MTWRAAVVVFALLVAPLARAQEAIDADFRMFDVVVVEGVADPIEGTILEGRDPGASRLKIRTRQGVITEFPRNKVREITDRETAESAFRTRAARIKERGTAGEHRLLGEWALRHGLRAEGEGELRLAAEVEQDAARSLAHRERLIGLVEERLADLTGAARDAALEALLAEVSRAEAKGGASARLLLARARVAREVGLPEVARGALEAARDALEGRRGGEADPATPARPEQPAPPRPPERPPARFGRDGEGLERPPPPPRHDTDAPPALPDDHGDRELPGLSHPERDVWRQALLLLGAVEARDGRLAEAADAYERVLEVWPQERAACLGLARLRVTAGQRGAAQDLLTAALKVFPRDGELLLVRGQVRALLGDLEGARQDLSAVLTAVRPPDDSALARDVRAALGLVLVLAGEHDKAGPSLEAADAPPGHGPARLARGLLAERQGDLAAARAHYEEAARLLAPRAGDAHYALSFLLAGEGDAAALDAAVGAIRAAARQGVDLELCLRALTDLAVRRGDPEAELRLLELHARTAAPGPDLLARLGRSYLRQERHDEARALFERALEQAPDHAASLRGLAFVAYARDDRPRAKELFERLLKLDPQDGWAARGQRNLEEARTRRVWVDAFDRPGREVKNAWRVEAPFGLKVEMVDGKVFLAGRQQNEAEGRTRLVRTVQGEHVVKLEARLHLDRLGESARAGLRFETGHGGVVLFRDTDGGLKVTWSKSKTAPLEDPRPLGAWPGHGPRTLAIEVENPQDGTVALWVDGVRRGELKVPGFGRDRGDAELSVYAQGTRLDEQVEVVLEEVRIYVRRER
ncbi:MAG: tetratricopeptide repeat protein [Planctomycetes bacterium]|nr:tetratricopeptide repeat protein [Planctomycetota bacterium]